MKGVGQKTYLVRLKEVVSLLFLSFTSLGC